MPLTNISTSMFVFAEKMPGLSVQYLETLPFFEFFEYRMLLDKKLDAEQKEATKQQQEYAKSQKSFKPSKKY